MNRKPKSVIAAFLGAMFFTCTCSMFIGCGSNKIDDLGSYSEYAYVDYIPEKVPKNIADEYLAVYSMEPHVRILGTESIQKILFYITENLVTVHM